jgi:1-acyl-sn-glycerol-3-phosphate acyltransferase
VIKAENHSLYTPFWRWYIKNSVRGQFSSVRLFNSAHAHQSRAMLWHGTHVSFWDGYLGLQLAEYLKLEYRVMMLEANLKKYDFLRFAGAFGIDRGNTRGALLSLRYATTELQNPAPRALLMFPSGEIGSPHQRPIPFESGIASLANLCAKEQDLAVAALAIRLEYGTEAKPVAFLRLGKPRIVQVGKKTSDLTILLQDDLEQEANALHQDLLEGNVGAYQIIVQGSSSIPEIWDAFRRKYLTNRLS